MELKGRSWIVKRSYEDFRVLDKHLHLCIYDRRFSQLPELPRLDSLTDQSEVSSGNTHIYTHFWLETLVSCLQSFNLGHWSFIYVLTELSSA